MTQYDPEIILKAVNDKDMQAWEAVFGHFYPALCAYSQHFVEDSATAEDVVQEVMVNVWKGNHVFEEVEDLSLYLYRAAYRQSLMHLRNRQLHAKHLQKFSLEQSEWSEEDFAATVREELIRQLRLHIDQLPAERRKILLLSIEGYSNSEIAEEQGISVNTVKVQKHRGFKYLREKIQQPTLWLLLAVAT